MTFLLVIFKVNLEFLCSLAQLTFIVPILMLTEAIMIWYFMIDQKYLQQFGMNNPSQIFEVILSPEESFQLVSSNDFLKKENSQMKQKIASLEQQAQQHASKQYPQQILKLSKSTLQLGKLLLDRNNQQQKEQSLPDRSMIQKLEEEREQREQQVKTLQGELDELKVKISNLESGDIITKQQIQALRILNAELKQQIQMVYKQQINQLSAEIMHLNQKIATMQLERKDNQYLMLNERLLLQQKTQLLEKRQSHFKEHEQRIIMRESELQNKLKQQQALINERMIELEQNYASMSKDLQASYEKSIASLKDFTQSQETAEQYRRIAEEQRKQTEYFQAQIAKLEQEKVQQHKKIERLKKHLAEANDKLNYIKQLYEDVENPENTIISLYVNVLIEFYYKLLVAGEKNVMEKVSQKKEQMFKTITKSLEQRLKKEQQ